VGWAAGSALAALLLLGGLSLAVGQTPSGGAENPSPKKKKFEAPPSAADKIKLKAVVEPEKVRRGQTFKVVISGTPEAGWHTFPITKQLPKQEDYKSELQALEMPPEGLKPVGTLVESEPQEVNDQTVGRVLEHTKPFTWSQEFVVLPEAKPGSAEITIKLRLPACDEHLCLPPEVVTLQVKVDISAEEPVQLSNATKEKLAAPAPAAGITPLAPPTPNAPAAGGQDHSGLMAFLLTGVIMGFVSLLTPCVFPMIPITVSFFLKQSEKEHHRPITMALVYCLTIIVVLTIAALALLSFFRWLSVNPVMNFILGGLFVFFALSLFGMYEIELPHSLARFTSAREGRGGLLGTMFMALTFTIISFTCVAPFLGGFGSTAVDANLTFAHRLLGGFAFAVAFASPFFFLALFPNLLRKMPKSGAWLNSVKVVMGFLELAAALKFFRTAELVSLPHPVLFTYDLVLGLYVALALLCGLYLLGVYRLPHDTPVEHLSVPRMLFSLLFLGLAFYMTPALFKNGATGQSQRPNGEVFAWLDSFLLPEEQESGTPATQQAGLATSGESTFAWSSNLDKGLERARAEKRLVFIDFTGVSCTNCRYNEQNVFNRDTVQSLLKKYSLVKLYTDKVPAKFYHGGGTNVAKQQEDAQANLDFQRKEFGTEALPLYVILQPLPTGGFREVGRREGRIMDPTDFLQFLETPLAMNGSGSSGSTAAAETTTGPVVVQR
jgi:thiol:disulfide interchange protein DsbD